MRVVRFLSVAIIDCYEMSLPQTNVAAPFSPSSALLDAAENGELDTLTSILEAFRSDRRLDINAVQRGTGETALMFAALNDDLRAVHVLLSHGANPALRDSEGDTALMMTIDVAVMRLLIDGGCPVHAADRDGDTVLHLAARRGDARIVQYLAKRGAALNAQNRAGERALDLALAGRHTTCLAVLAAQDSCTVDAVDPSGHTPLWTAAKEGYVQAVKILLERGAYVDWPAPHSLETPLMRAASSGATGVARVLLGYGASLTARNAQGFTALQLALRSGYSGVVGVFYTSIRVMRGVHRGVLDGIDPRDIHAAGVIVKQALAKQLGVPYVPGPEPVFPDVTPRPPEPSVLSPDERLRRLRTMVAQVVGLEASGEAEGQGEGQVQQTGRSVRKLRLPLKASLSPSTQASPVISGKAPPLLPLGTAAAVGRATTAERKARRKAGKKAHVKDLSHIVELPPGTVPVMEYLRSDPPSSSSSPVPQARPSNPTSPRRQRAEGGEEGEGVKEDTAVLTGSFTDVSCGGEGWGWTYADRQESPVRAAGVAGAGVGGAGRTVQERERGAAAGGQAALLGSSEDSESEDSDSVWDVWSWYAVSGATPVSPSSHPLQYELVAQGQGEEESWVYRDEDRDDRSTTSLSVQSWRAGEVGGVSTSKLPSSTWPRARAGAGVGHGVPTLSLAKVGARRSSSSSPSAGTILPSTSAGSVLLSYGAQAKAPLRLTASRGAVQSFKRPVGVVHGTGGSALHVGGRAPQDERGGGRRVVAQRVMQPAELSVQPIHLPRLGPVGGRGASRSPLPRPAAGTGGGGVAARPWAGAGVQAQLATTITPAPGPLASLQLAAGSDGSSRSRSVGIPTPHGHARADLLSSQRRRVRLTNVL